MLFVLKTFVSAGVISIASWLAGRKPVLAGFLIALPLASVISILFTHYEYRDMQRINQFASSILIATPLSLVFFVPFALNKWMKMGFWPAFVMALLFLAAAYFIAAVFLKIDLTK